MRFLDLQAHHFEESTPYEPKQLTTVHKSYATSIEEERVACGKGIHALSSCDKFHAVTRDGRWELVMKNAWCKNCLKKPGHIVIKC